jgi:nucleotide-binding universal stress UspA family protein
MFKHILTPVDGSTLSECALPHAVTLSQAFDARVTLLRVVERNRTSGLSRAIDPLHWQIRKAEARAYLEELASRFEEAGLQPEEALLEGDAAEHIVAFARNHDVDLIVMSTHGQSGLSGWNVSSVVQKVILGMHIPVMIVRAYMCATSEMKPLQYQRLMVPLDGSPRAECILPLATTLARLHECPLLLAHVVAKPEVARRTPPTAEEMELVDQLTERNRQAGAQYLEQLKSQLPSEVETRLLISDNAAVTLHELVKQENIDLMLLSAHGYSGEARWPYGSIALNFIVYGTTPLLIMQDIPEKTAQHMEAERAAMETKGH